MAPVATSTAPEQLSSLPLSSDAAPKKAAKSASSSSSSGKAHPLIDLYSGSSEGQQSQTDTLRAEILEGLKGSKTSIVPGSTEDAEDVKWAYNKTLPTMILYDEEGLRLYDEVSAELAWTTLFQPC
jgi:tRNA-specific adenosine deaminase 2